MDYYQRLEMSPEERDLFMVQRSYPDTVQGFADLDDSGSSVSYLRNDPNDFWHDRCFSFEFENGILIEIVWTLPEDTLEWYLGGAQFGTMTDMLYDLDECDPSTGTELAEKPVSDVEPAVIGQYVYTNNGDRYIMEIA